MRTDAVVIADTLEEAADALFSRSSVGLRTAAAKLATLVSTGDTDLIEPLLIVAKALPDVGKRAGVYNFAARYATPGSALEQLARAGFRKAAATVPPSDPRAWKIGYYVPIGTALGELADEYRMLPKDPTKSEKIAAFVQRFSAPH
jgi:hypothetical protein